MAMSKGRKICIALACVLAFVFLILPFLLGVFLRGTVEKKISEAVGAPTKLGSLSITLIPAGAVLSDLTVGESEASAGNQPLAKIEYLKANVSYGSVFGGELHVTNLKIHGADVNAGCDEKGASTFAKFLDKMPASTRTAALPIDSFSVRDSHIRMHVPKALLAPGAGLEPEPVEVNLRRLSVDNLVLPAPGQCVPKEGWTGIKVSGVTIRTPFKSQKDEQGDEKKEQAPEEGLDVKDIEGQILFPDAATKPLRIKGVKMEGLRVLNQLRKPNDPETLEIIGTARAACLTAPPPKPGEKGMSLGNGGIYLEDMTMGGSTIEIQGPDATGKDAYDRFADLKMEIAKLGFGPGTAALADGPGHVKIESPLKTSAGDGSFLLEWTDIKGSWPELSFKKKLELKGFALAAVSSRVEKASGAGVSKGTLSSEFAGTTTNGKIEWDGSMTLSKDTQMEGKGYTGKMVSSLAKVATGEPIKTIRIRGTLLDPTVDMPDFAAGALYSIGKGVISGSPSSVFKVFGNAMGSAMDQGVRESKKVIDKVGLGGLLGTEEKSK
ncbi:MAG: hypothetical protein HY291_11450 [Planctomycetes bacterium]|nr:hypothetical protein [Planctomycetota bacterium]